MNGVFTAENVQRVQGKRRDAASEYGNAAARIANISCHDSTSEQILAELSRWNFANNGLSLPRPGAQSSNHPMRILFKTMKAMVTGTDGVNIRKAHWSELAVDPRWQVRPNMPLFSQDQLARRERPLYRALKRCKPGEDRALMGKTELFMHTAVCDTVNHILAASGESATSQEVDYFIGTSTFVRPIRQNSINWRALTTAHSRRVAVWTLAVACSMWGQEFVDSFLEFCTAVLAGPVCGATRDECKEAFAACVAVTTVARARGAITNTEIAGCTRALWVLQVIDLACSAAHGTLWTSRYIHKTKGERITVSACNKWETPIDPNLNPTNFFCVSGGNCQHAQKVNKDGTSGVSCAGRWTVVTKLEDLGEQQMQDHQMRVTLTHQNVPAVNNILAVLERRGLWAYVQGQQECLTCAYRRALRHGFPVIVDSPQHSTPVTFPSSKFFSLGGAQFWSLLLFLFTLTYLIPCISAQSTAQSTAPQLPLSSIFKPNATCEQFSGPPVRGVVSWTSLFSIIRALQSVIMTFITIRSGKRFVRKTPFNLVTAVISTLFSGATGWLITPGCTKFKVVAILKGLVSAAVNRLAYEMIDILCMVVSIAGILFTIIFTNVDHNAWALLQPAQISLIFLSLSYVWRWLDTGIKQSTSRGVVGAPIPLFVSHVVALILAVISFVFHKQKDSTSGVASYLSDGTLMGEVFMQFFLLV